MAKQYDDFDFELEYEDDFAPAGFKPKRKNNQETVTWKDAWLALGTFLLGMGLVSLISFFAQQIFMGDLLEAYANANGSYGNLYDTYGSPATSMQLGTFSNFYTDPLFMVASIGISLVFTLIMLLMMYGIMHLVATLLNGGNGTFRGLIYRANGWTFGVYLVLTIISMVAVFIWMDDIVAASEALAMGGEPTVFLEGMLQYAGVQYASYFLGWVVWLYGMSGVLAKNYRYATSSGCVTLAVSHVIYVVSYIGLSIVLGLLIVGLAFNAM